MQWLIQYAIGQCGIPYKWGGSNPLEGFDCSGLVQWLLASAGMDPPGDQSAQALYTVFESVSSHGVFQPGALAFYGNSLSEITHVAFCIDSFRMVEAGGGDHLTLTREDAAKKNACVRMRLIQARKDFLITLKPNYSKIGLA